VLYNDGRFHREESSQSPGKPPETKVFESSLAPGKLEEVRALLDSSDLKNSTHQAASDEWAAEVEVIKLSIPRGYFVQDLVFANYFPLQENVGGVGLSNNLQRTDKEQKIIKPLQAWLKANVERNNSNPVNTAGNNCQPE
jgi:hypothetical protein